MEKIKEKTDRVTSLINGFRDKQFNETKSQENTKINNNKRNRNRNRNKNKNISNRNRFKNRKIEKLREIYDRIYSRIEQMSNRQYDNFDRFRDKPVRRRPNQGSRRRNKINNSNYNKFRDENGVRQRLWDKYNELISRIEAIRDREEKNSNKKEKTQRVCGGMTR